MPPKLIRAAHWRQSSFLRRSIKTEYAVIFILLMLGTLILCMAGSVRFLRSYYLHEKQQVALSLYAKLDAQDSSDDGSLQQIRLTCSQQDLSLILMKDSSYFVVGDPLALQRKLFTHMKSIYDNIPIGVTIEETDNYILKYLDDDMTGTKELVLNGFLTDGSPILISTPLVGIETNAGISNRFFIRILLFSAIIGGIIIYLVSFKVSRPILTLAKISQDIAEFKFESHYNGREVNEIGILGQNINRLSNELEQNISRLKAANNELRRDLENKEQQEIKRRDFLSGVSHDLKTPIALIQGYAECLQECGDEVDSKYYCSVIADESRKMGEIVKKLLMLEQIETDSVKDEIVRIDVMEIINNICYAYEKYVEEIGTQIIVESVAPQLFIWSVEWKIEQVLRNYISNAINHTDKTVPIKITVTDDRVSVFNPGTPIPADALDKIWDKFYKTDQSRSREYGGNGIGLSLVKAAQESMGLDFGAQNADGGVVFWFEINR